MRRSTTLLLVAAGLCLTSAGFALLRHSSARPLPQMRVEVLNGSGQAGAAAAAAERMRGWGLDVVAVGDAPRKDHPRTFLIDRGGRPALTQRLAERLGDVLVVLERVERPQADAVLVLGQDGLMSRVPR